MRMRTPATIVALSLLALAASGCGGGAPDPKHPDGKESGGGDGLKVGDKAPSFALDSLNGQGKLAINPGKVTIVDFWATWCEPCKKSFPKYQELYVKYKASGLEIVAVSVDDEDKKSAIPDFAKTHGGAKFPVGWDEGHKIADKWKQGGMPSAYVIDKTGVIRHVHKGYHDGEDAEIEKEIKALL
jgi:cytochrome c biogenesis protein CcmG, thiol:disulfide interchange protein DsbE